MKEYEINEGWLFTVLLLAIVIVVAGALMLVTPDSLLYEVRHVISCQGSGES